MPEALVDTLNRLRHSDMRCPRIGKESHAEQLVLASDLSPAALSQVRDCPACRRHVQGRSQRE